MTNMIKPPRGHSFLIFSKDQTKEQIKGDSASVFTCDRKTIPGLFRHFGIHPEL